MAYRAGKLFSGAVLACLLWPRHGWSQDQAAPATVDTPSASTTLPRPRELPPPSSGPLIMPAPGGMPPLPPYVDNGDADIAPDDPLLNPPGQGPGWFFGVDVGIVKPHVKSHFSSGGLGPLTGGPAPVAGTTQQASNNNNPGGPFSNAFQIANAPLDWSAMPILEAGYRFGKGAGSLALKYRFLDTAGSETVANFDAAGAGDLRSRLSVNRVDLAYFTSQYLMNPMPNTLFSQWGGLGVTAADIFFDSRIMGQEILQEHASNNFAGVGPSLWYGWTKYFPSLPVALYGRTNMAYYLGKTQQHVSATQLLGNGQILSGSSSIRPESDGTGIFSAEAGLSYAPGWFNNRLRFSAGYHWERWWFLSNSDFTTNELTIQGAFLRSELNY